ncbi:MAG: inositol monophosphatase family protein [Bacteroidota bacterium]
MNSLNLPELLLQTLSACRPAAAFIHNETLSFTREKVEYKGMNDMVSYVDREAEKLLVAALRKILPQAGFITEEGTEGDYNAAARIPDALHWIIDPLDGTTNFVHGIPHFCVSVALAMGNTPVLGVIIDVMRNEEFYGCTGGGAFLNGKPIHVSPNTDFSSSLPATGFPYNTEGHAAIYTRILAYLMTRCHGLRRFGSAALDMAWVACGRLDAYFEKRIQPWDIAAGMVIVREAGGSCSTFKNDDDCLFAREIVCGGAVKEDLRQVVAGHWYPEEQV